MERWLALTAAALSTAVFIVTRNSLDLEDTRFIAALLAFSTLAMALSVAGTALLGRRIRSAAVYGIAAFILVPVLYVAYLVLFVIVVCMIAGKTCYS